MVGTSDQSGLEGADGSTARDYLGGLSAEDFRSLQSLALPYEVAPTYARYGPRVLWGDAGTRRDMARRNRIRRVLLDRGRESGHEECVRALLDMAEEVARERTTRLLSEESDHEGRVDCNCRCGDDEAQGETGFDGRDCGDMVR